MFKFTKKSKIQIFITIFLLPKIVLADGIDLPIAINFGFSFIIFITILLASIESFILAKFLKTKNIYFIFSIIANILSSVVGIPLIMLSYLIFQIPDKNITDIAQNFFYKSILIYFLFFAETLLVEYLSLIKFTKIKKLKLSKQQLFYAITIANITTYLILCPVHYNIAKPDYNIKSFSTNSSWATGTSTILFLDSHQYLNKIQINGQNRQTLIPFSIIEYSTDKKLNTFLIRDKKYNLYYFNKTNKEKILIKPKYIFNLTTTALNKKTNKVAFLSFQKYKQNKKEDILNTTLYNLTLNIYDLNKKTTNKIDLNLPKINFKDETLPIIEWKSNNVIILQTHTNTSEIKTNLNITIQNNVATISTSTDNILSPRVGLLNSSIKKTYDKFRDKQAITTHELFDGYITISENNKKIIYFANNPGVFHHSKEILWNPKLINNGEFVVFNGKQNIYIIDIKNKKMGIITQGTFTYHIQ